MNKVRLSNILIASMAGLFFMAVVLGPVLQKDPFYSLFYLLAWWPYIVAAEAWLWVRGKSLLFSRPARFLALVPLSALIWTIFEIFNFRLENWQYEFVKQSIFIRWPGYFLAFGTVLPGLLVTKKIIDVRWPQKSVPRTKTVDLRPYLPLIFSCGLAFIVLCLVYPRYCFALIWGAFVLLLDPFVYLAGRPCFLADLEHKNVDPLGRWLAAGLVCGLLWELWNFWAGSKWVYTVPWVGNVKIFEMPVLGFFGFPPFALECAVMIRFVDLLHARLKLRYGQRKRWRIYSRLLLGTAAFFVLSFIGIDLLTVQPG